MKKWKKPLFVVLLSTVGLLVALVAGAVMYANFYVNDEDIHVSEELIPDGAPKRIMAIFAHPDDEIMIAGTYHKLNKDKDVTSVLATFTRGEAGGTGGLVPKEKLGETRTKELEKSADILNIDHLEVYDYPDSGLVDADHEDIKKTIKELIHQYKPTTVITYDDIVGLYGHPDHVVMSKLTKEVVTEEMEKEDSTVKRLYFATLPKPMIDLHSSSHLLLKRDTHEIKVCQNQPSPSQWLPRHLHANKYCLLMKPSGKPSQVSSPTMTKSLHGYITESSTASIIIWSNLSN